MVTLTGPAARRILDVFVGVQHPVSVLLFLLVTMNVRSSMSSTFPAVLLFATLFRLGLNVASTRLILSRGARAHHHRPSPVRRGRRPDRLG
jgi:flagellar biosynthesis protein FlhA